MCVCVCVCYASWRILIGSGMHLVQRIRIIVTVISQCIISGGAPHLVGLHIAVDSNSIASEHAVRIYSCVFACGFEGILALLILIDIL